jgi:beta-lactamase class A
MVLSEIDGIFRGAGCEGALCVQSLDDGAEVGLRADRSVVAASVIKVLFALEAETWFADRRMDPRECVVLNVAERTPGPAGIPLFEDDVVVSWRDLVVLMLTISDNHATDALLCRIGVDAVNATAARLGLTDTVVKSDLKTMLDSIGQDLGRAGWADLFAWSSSASAEAVERADEWLPTVRALDAEKATRTTPCNMVRLLRLIWSDQAGPAAACGRVRALMARQLTRHRLASAFRPPVNVAAKSGAEIDAIFTPAAA